MAQPKFRVRVVVDNHMGLKQPETKYVIERKAWIFGWDTEHKATSNKEWAYETCEEMNTKYEDIREKRKTNKNK